MSFCPGTRGKSKCNSTIYKCKHCGGVGCDHGSRGACTNQGFASGTCQHCGKSGGKQSV